MFGMFHPHAALLSANDMNNTFPVFPVLECDHGIQWIHAYFADCVDTEAKLFGFGVGILSLLIWFAPAIPQLYENYKLKQAEGLATGFLACWLIGDLSNMVGAVLTNQQAIQKCIGVYYIIQDLTLISQFVYYRKIYSHSKKVRTLALAIAVTLVASLSALTALLVYATRSGVAIDLRFGYGLGVLSAVCYCCGRSSQIHRNHKRKSCEGMASSMFCVTIAGNVTYALAILLECTDLQDVLRHSPWLIGSCLCILLDIALITQARFYKPSKHYNQLVAVL